MTVSEEANDDPFLTEGAEAIASGALNSHQIATPPVSMVGSNIDRIIVTALAIIQEGVARPLPNDADAENLGVDLWDDEATDIALRLSYLGLPKLALVGLLPFCAYVCSYIVIDHSTPTTAHMISKQYSPQMQSSCNPNTMPMQSKCLHS